MPCLILSIDGGGLRGLIPVLILKHIEEKVQASNRSNRKLVTYFNLIAGTSTGGLIACGMSLGTGNSTGDTQLDLDELENLYRAKGNEIFPYKGKLRDWLRRSLFSIWNYWRPQFGKQGIENVLTEIFRDKKISDCIRPILITTYNVSTHEPYYFSTRKLYDGKHNVSHDNLLTQVCRATSAGPTYLPASMVWSPQRMICIDGGVFQNNPATTALVDVLMYPDIYGVKGAPIDDVFLLSLGTGRFNEPVSSKTAFKGGRLNWIAPLIDIGMWGNSQAVDKHIEEVLKSNTNKKKYLRINVMIDQSRFADMAVSSREAMDYYTQRVQKDYLTNDRVQAELDQWLKDSGIITN
jgi:uncharacterized protein